MNFLAYRSWVWTWTTHSSSRETQTRINGLLSRNTILDFPILMDLRTSFPSWTTETRACMSPNNVTSLSSLPCLQKKKSFINYKVICKVYKVYLQIITKKKVKKFWILWYELKLKVIYFSLKLFYKMRTLRKWVSQLHSEWKHDVSVTSIQCYSQDLYLLQYNRVRRRISFHSEKYFRFQLH